MTGLPNFDGEKIVAETERNVPQISIHTFLTSITLLHH